eukprot:1535984-Rhodomonas_salina.1
MMMLMVMMMLLLMMVMSMRIHRAALAVLSALCFVQAMPCRTAGAPLTMAFVFSPAVVFPYFLFTFLFLIHTILQFTPARVPVNLVRRHCAGEQISTEMLVLTRGNDAFTGDGSSVWGDQDGGEDDHEDGVRGQGGGGPRTA